ncbi:MAG TPA: prolyl oligopeptidase family serine peptidase [Longimicrobiales bacterium]
MKRVIFAVLAIGACAASLHAQSFDLSIKNIMRGPELVGAAPERVQWTDDSRWVYFRWRPGGLPWTADTSWYRVAATGGAPEKLTSQVADSLTVLIAGGPRSPDQRTRVVAHNGDLYLINRQTLAVRRLTDTRPAESNPVFARNGTTVFFVRDNNVHSLDLTTGALRQLTDLRAGPAPEEAKPAEGQRRFLEQQQAELFEHIRKENQDRAAQEAQRKEREARALKTVFLTRGEQVGPIAVNESGSHALLRTNRDGGTGRRTLIPDWVTRSGYTETIEVRTKVGDLQGELGRIGIASLGTGDVRWIDVTPTRNAETDSAGRTIKLSGTRIMDWNAAGTHALVSALSVDFKDQWLFVVEAATGKLTQLAHEHNNAWIGGPCDFWNGCAGWLPNGDIYYVSERDGYSHVYLVNANGGSTRQLTKGQFEVYGITLSPNKDRLYVTSNEGSPFERHFYHITFDGQRTRVTTAPGRQDAVPSPDGSRLAMVHSTANTPPELYLADNRAGAEMRRITTSPTPEWLSYKWITPPIVQFRARDGVMVPARIYRPRDFNVQPNGAAVIFVHGAGYLQNVHNWWSTYYREYMFHHILASRGYTVLDVDYRGSQGYGAEWRTAIYRYMGGKDLTDQVDGAHYLAASEGVDAKRIGIYGGSYGGFITLMALFTQPNEFAAGAALRSVTDWAHYNHGYTGRILNFPHEDTVAYRRSSPIYFAEGLQDPLLILHGMVDTNVHYSDVVRLTQRLIELGKTNWEMAVYPVEDHGFVEPASWTDEYRRIFELFERHLR